LQSALRERIGAFDRQIATPQQGTLLPIRMVPIGDEMATIAAARWLLDRGFYTSATFFPTVARGGGGIRICLTSTHSEREVDALCALLTEVRTRAAAARPSPRNAPAPRDRADLPKQSGGGGGDEFAVLHTPRLLLLPMDQSHELELHCLHTDPFVVASILDGEPPTIEQTRERLRLYLRDWQTEGWGFWMVYQKQNGRTTLAGRCGVRRFAGTGDVELGHCFLEEASGKGIAVEAARAIAHHLFAACGVRRLVAVIAPTNARALKAASKLGLRHIDDRRHNGKWRHYFELDREAFLSACHPLDAAAG
jgi:ribosomal-protein-alanine N-acetyltransferase